MSSIETPRSETNAELRRRVGGAWREIRRGASAARIKGLFYGEDGDEEALDMALADALAVVSAEGPLRMGALADALHITPASTTRAVSCLVEKGFAERVKAEDDQRSVVVSSTDHGDARYAAIVERVNSGLDQILSEFTKDEQEQLAELLERFVSAVDHYVESNDQS